MKQMLLVAILSLAFTGQAAAQANKIELYTDVNRSSCEVADQGFALVTIHAFETGPTKSTAIRFKAAKGACWAGATWVGDTTDYVQVGNSQTDLSVAYGFCLQPPIHVAQINFIVTGGAAACCELVATQSFPGAFVHTDCLFGEYAITAGQKVVINPNDSCRCQQPLATEPSSWGRVKALYR
jgi:hypothetical protein